MTLPAKQKRAFSVSNLATPFGGCNFFDRCSDELMSLHFGGELGLLDWMGFNVSEEYLKTLEFLTFNRPAYSNGSPTAGNLATACAEPNGIEYGYAKISTEGFGRYGRVGPTRDIMTPKLYCKTDPRKRLDGSPVADENEWDIRFATEVLIDDIRRDLVVGSTLNAGEFDGLERWVKTGYAHDILDSVVIDWNANGMAGGAGVTWNGAAVASTYGFIDVLIATFRRIKTRISWTRMLSGQRMREGDIILVVPSFLRDPILDAFTCWSVCPGKQYNETNLNTYEARQFRTQLMGGMFGEGEIYIDGFTIPVMTYDYGLIKGPTRGDVYFLTGSVGSVRIWEGEHIDAGRVARTYGDHGYFTLDGGRVLGKVETENECRKMKIWMHPRLFCKAPWAQVRFQDVKADALGGIMSPDPTETSFYPQSSFVAAECP